MTRLELDDRNDPPALEPRQVGDVPRDASLVDARHVAEDPRDTSRLPGPDASRLAGAARRVELLSATGGAP